MVDTKVKMENGVTPLRTAMLEVQRGLFLVQALGARARRETSSGEHLEA